LGSRYRLFCWPRAFDENAKKARLKIPRTFRVLQFPHSSKRGRIGQRPSLG
jgi:hypothetical protein